jgi:chromosome transmission fidelity protein 1
VCAYKGRSIRHANDYATILLIDKRYRRDQIINKLPKWISSRLSETQNFGHAFSKIGTFFKRKRDHQLAIEMQRRQRNRIQERK